MAPLAAIGAQAGSYSSGSHIPLETALVFTGGGLLFTVIGFVLWTDYRGGRRFFSIGDTEAELKGLISMILGGCGLLIGLFGLLIHLVRAL